MRSKTAVIVALTLVAATTSLAGVDEMALSREGTPYRLVHMDDRLVLLIDEPAGLPGAPGASNNLPSSVNAVPVPQTTGVFPSNLNLGFDHRSGTAVAVWQEVVDSETARVMLATFRAGTWFGPVAVAGDDGLTATNPVLLVHEYITVDEFGNEIITSFIHLSWWRGGDDNGGYAEYQGMPVNDDGTPVGPDVTDTDPAHYFIGDMETLRVRHRARTASGFTLRFNRPFDPTELSLHDVADGSLGEADVTLVGNRVGLVRGSLVIGDRSLTFVASTEALPPDAYTLRLRSAANGFVDLPF